MKIGYRRRYANLFTVAALLLGMLTVLMVPINGWDYSLINLTFSAVIFLSFSLAMRRMTYFELQDKRLIVYPLFSRIRRPGRSYAFQSTDDFELMKNRLYLHRGGQRVKIPIYPNNVEPEDWKTFLQALKLTP